MLNETSYYVHNSFFTCMLFPYFFSFRFNFSECRSLHFFCLPPIPCYYILCHVMLCYVIVCYTMLCYVILCNTMLHYYMLYYTISCLPFLFTTFLLRSSYLFFISSTPSMSILLKRYWYYDSCYFIHKTNYRYSGAQKMKIKAEALESWELEKWLR